MYLCVNVTDVCDHCTFERCADAHPANPNRTELVCGRLHRGARAAPSNMRRGALALLLPQLCAAPSVFDSIQKDVAPDDGPKVRKAPAYTFPVNSP